MKLYNFLVTAAILAFLCTTIEIKAQWLNGTNIFNTNSGYVGIGTGSSISSKLHVTGGGVLFSGTTGTTPVSGAGTRLMWIPAKAAFRAGLVNSTEWDDVNIGNYSIGLGAYNKASGLYSLTLGSSNIASGSNAIAVGDGNNVTGNQSYAFGESNTITASTGTALGLGNTVSNSFGLAIGGANVSGSSAIGIGSVTSSGSYSFSLGHFSTANSTDAFSIGYNVIAGATNAHIIGSGLYPSGGTMTNVISNSLMIGYNSNIPTLFVGGSAGTGTTGNVGIGNSTPAYKLDITGTAAMTGFKLGSSSTAGYVLTTDINGNGTWQAPGTGTGPFSYSGNDIYNNNIGNVAIGKSTASYKLDVNGTAAVTGFKLGTSSTAGYILTTDANGNGTWQLPAAAGSGAWTFSGNDVYNVNSGNLGIGLVPTAGAKLQVGGTVSMTGLKVGTSSTIGNVLTAVDAVGNATWQAPSWTVSGNNIYNANSGSVGIGISSPKTGSKLHVNGPVLIGDATVNMPSPGITNGYNLYVQYGILTERIKVAVKTSTSWADYVFDKDYKLTPLNELSAYIKNNHHLPEIPSANEVVENGINLGDMDAKLLMKIEELTLHLIKMNEQVENLNKKVENLEIENSKLIDSLNK